MSLNLKCYCRQSIGAWAYKQCKFSCISVDLNILFIRVQIRSHTFKFKKLKDVHAKAPLYIFFYSLKEMSEFCKSVKLRRFKNKKNCKITLFNQCRFIRILLCSKMSNKMIRRFYDIIKSCLSQVCRLYSSAFFLKLTVEQYFKSLANKNNSQESPFLHIFFRYDPKEVRVLTNSFFQQQRSEDI